MTNALKTLEIGVFAVAQPVKSVRYDPKNEPAECRIALHGLTGSKVRNPQSAELRSTGSRGLLF